MADVDSVEVTPEMSSLSLYNVLRPSYRPRKVRNKGAVLTLLWNFCGFTYIFFVISMKDIKTIEMVLPVTIVVFPLAGWLADVRFGRYKVMRFSTLISWLSVILYVVALMLDVQSVQGAKVLKQVSVAAGMLSFSSFQANAIQFGVDQLADASSMDISSYISWLAWLYFLNQCIMRFSLTCVCENLRPVFSLLGPSLLTLALCLDLLFNQWLVKEPATFNPLRLVFQVVRYSFRHKYPTLRSALMSWDHSRSSRLDLAKEEYGGPFTAAEVEDVKTFFKMLVIILCGSFYIGLVLVVNDFVIYKMLPHYQDLDYTEDCSANLSAFVKNCFMRAFIPKIASLLMVIFIPVLELVLYPLFQKHILRFGIMNKFILGMVVYFLCQLGLLLLEVVGHHMTANDSSNYNITSNITCILNLKLTDPPHPHHGLSLDFKWLALPSFMKGLGTYCLFTSTAEFVCAQAPYSMKGLLGGVIYSLSGLSMLLSVAAELPFQHTQWGHSKWGCGVWYFVFVVTVSAVMIIVGCVATKWYSKRRKGESLPLMD